MRFIQKIGFVLVTILSIVGLVGAQDECPASVDEAILALNDICLSVGRNQACYGNGDIVAVPQPDAMIDFGVPGDTALVDDIQSMTLSPFEVGIEEWGVALLVLQADLPDTLPGQNVTMLLFGDVSIANDSGAYYFTAGIGTTSCNQAPNGILIQTPEGAGEVNLVMNGINISLGSTAYLTTSEDNVLTFALLEGNSTLTIDDSDVELETEQFTTVDLDEDGNATGEFTPPAPIADLALPELPTLLLPEDINAEDDSETASTSGEQIIPLSGTWRASVGETVFTGDCPAMIQTPMQQSVDSLQASGADTRELVFDGEVNFEQLFDTSGLDGNYVIEDSEPNMYRISLEFSEEGSGISLVNTWRILSETSIQGEFVMSFSIPNVGDCTSNATFNYEYVE
ncbi:MAG: hypothetical protein Phog2KO_17970 [Phototrophicaceae bacterium]